MQSKRLYIELEDPKPARPVENGKNSKQRFVSTITNPITRKITNGITTVIYS